MGIEANDGLEELRGRSESAGLVMLECLLVWVHEVLERGENNSQW